MNEETSDLSDSLRQKFPQMRPLKGTPSLFTLNGFGLGMYGKRDYDPETETYIKTHCLCALFVPLCALGAYRVADAEPRGWYFLGRETLSNFARSWNTAMGCLVVFAGLALGWNIHTSSPEYRARQELNRAAELLAGGRPVKAAGIYRQQLDSSLGAEARRGLQQSVEACLQSDEPQAAAAALRVLASLPARVNQPEPLVPDAFRRGLSLVEQFRTTDLEGAIQVLEEAAALDPDNPAVRPLKVDLLRQAIAADPTDVARPVELALMYEEDNELVESVQVLLPYQERLGDTEGARILGQHLLGKGDHETAYALLFPYVQSRLDKLRNVEASYTNVLNKVSERALADLNEGRVSLSWYEKYDRSSQDVQEEMVDAYVLDRLQADANYQRALAELKEANRIVPVTLDLGIVQLNRAQNLTDPAARTAELEAAEETFLAIKGFASETDEYRLFLGQVYYWLGKSNEGRALFDELLASQNRAYPILMSLSQTLRAVGEQVQARGLAEEAYQSAASPEDRFSAAYLRALIFKDTDDQIAWLEKADPEQGYIQIELNSARGKKALLQDDKTLAAKFLLEAINGYEKQPRSSSSLNNRGLAYFDLYEATGNIQDHERGLALLEEAILLEPGNSILINNTMYFLFSQAVMDVLHGAIHTEVLGAQPGLQLLSHLYKNDQERGVIYQQLREDENMKRALAYLDKVLLLSPKSIGPYSTALSIHLGFRDLGELQKLQRRFHVAAPDLTEVREETLAVYQGAKDQETLEQVQVKIRKFENLMALPAVQQHELTLEHVTVSLLALQQTAWSYGQPADSAKMLATAQAMHRRHQSLASQHALMSVHFFRANEELSRQNPDYAALAGQTRRAVAPQDLLAFILERGGALANLALQNRDVLAALALERERVKDFSSWPSIQEWALLKTASPETAKVVERRLRENQVSLLGDQLSFELNPLSASTVLEQYWRHKMLGQEDQAVALYRQAVREGVPLPPL